jgi:hypothetical protein
MNEESFLTWLVGDSSPEPVLTTACCVPALGLVTLWVLGSSNGLAFYAWVVILMALSICVPPGLRLMRWSVLACWLVLAGWLFWELFLRNWWWHFTHS